MQNETITFEAKNNDPKTEDVKTYTIATMQDIADCVTIENLEGFLTDFQNVLLSYLLAKEMVKNVKLPSFEWTDDWK